MVTTRQRYETDLMDVEMLLVEALVPLAKAGGRRRDIDIRELLNAIFYQVRTGCAWRLLPHDFGIPWQTVYGYFSTWCKTGSGKR